MSGLTFQKELAKEGMALPVIFITGHGDIPMSVRAMKAGAVEFLSKPFHDQDLLDAIHTAIERDRKRRREALIAVRAAGALRYAYRARAADHGARRHRAGQQADRSGAQPQRDDGEGSPRASHAEDACGVAARARANGGPAGRAYRNVVGDYYQSRSDLSKSRSDYSPP